MLNLKNLLNMKNLSKLFSFAMIAMLAMAVTLTGCKDDDDDDEKVLGTANVGSTTANFTQGHLEYYGTYEGTGLYNFDIVLASSGLSYTSESGVGDVLAFELLVAGDVFNGGSFTFSDDIWDISANTMISGVFMKGINAATEVADKMYSATAGTLSVTKSGNSYSLAYTLTVQEYSFSGLYPTAVGDPVALTGSFNGTLTYHDESAKSVEKKQRISIK